MKKQKIKGANSKKTAKSRDFMVAEKQKNIPAKDMKKIERIITIKFGRVIKELAKI